LNALTYDTIRYDRRV